MAHSNLAVRHSCKTKATTGSWRHIFDVKGNGGAVKVVHRRRRQLALESKEARLLTESAPRFFGRNSKATLSIFLE